ncbi:MAG: metallophosphoesterase family protein [Hyphomicrobiaceae bacterium]
MKLAAIADIHGNCAALEAVLADIDRLGIDDIVNLGDHVSGPLEARKTAELLVARDFPSIQGDQDRRLLELYVRGPQASKRKDFCSLENEHFEWMARQPQTLTFQGEIFMCHGSPRGDTTFWLHNVDDRGVMHATSIDDIEAEAEGIEASVILCAHTHIPRIVRLRDGRLVVNPGSVGLPGYVVREPVEHAVQTGTPDACYAVLERYSKAWNVTFRYVPYDSKPMAELARSCNMPTWANALETGWAE